MRVAPQTRRRGSVALDELERLADAGDTLAVVALLGQLVRAPMHVGDTETARTLDGLAGQE